MRIILKKLFLATGLLLCAYGLIGQTVGRQLFGSGGSNSVPLNAIYYVSWSMGEPVVHTIDGRLPQLTQGFQQPETVLPLHPHAIELQGKVRMNDVWLSWADNLDGEHQYIIQYWRQGWKSLDSTKANVFKHTNARSAVIDEKLRYRILVAGIDGRIRTSNTIELSFHSQSEPLVYPSPTKGLVTVSNLHGKTTLHLMNTEGKKLLKTEIESDLYRIDLSSYPTGMYFLLVEGDDGTVFRRKIQKL